MKRAALSALVLTLSSVAFAAPVAYSAAQGTATFDHRVRGINVHGTIAGVTSSVRLDSGDLAATQGTVTVPFKNLKTGIAMRDSHAMSKEALNTAQFPTGTFELDKLTGGRLTEGQTLATTATGKLTVKGVTKAVTTPIKATLQGGKVNISTQFAFNPHDYGVDYPGSSDSVTVGVNFVLQAR